MNDKTRLPQADTPEQTGQSTSSDAPAKASPKTDERSPAEKRAETDLLKTSGGDPLTQEG